MNIYPPNDAKRCGWYLELGWLSRNDWGWVA